MTNSTKTPTTNLGGNLAVRVTYRNSDGSTRAVEGSYASVLAWVLSATVNGGAVALSQELLDENGETHYTLNF